VPVYEYACTECGERLEVRQSFTDDPLTECPVCSGRLRKVLSPVGVVFKGSGFYRNDSRKTDGASVGAGVSNGSGEKKSTENGAKQSASSGGESSGGESSGGSSGEASSSGSDGKSTSSSTKPKAATGS
jgi:putative FmdB family regulatory protein